MASLDEYRALPRRLIQPGYDSSLGFQNIGASTPPTKLQTIAKLISELTYAEMMELVAVMGDVRPGVVKVTAEDIVETSNIILIGPT